MMKSNAAGTGSSSITVQGVGFGLVGYSSQVRQGSTGCEATGWESETSVRCHVSVGMRGTRRVTMTSGEQGGSITEAWSMDRSEMSVVRRSNYAGTGSLSFVVLGYSVGFAAMSAAVRLGHSGCESTLWASASTVKCLAARASVAGTRRLAVTAGLGMSGSLTSSWSVDALVLNAVNQSNVSSINTG